MKEGGKNKEIKMARKENYLYQDVSS